MVQNTHDQVKYTLLAYIVPTTSLFAIIYYVLLAHILNLGFDGAYWGLLAFLWGVPLSIYLISYKIQLKQQYHRLPLLANIDEDEDEENDEGFDDGDDELAETYKLVVKKKKRQKDRKKKHKKDKLRNERVQFSSTVDVEDIFHIGNTKFYLSYWGKFGLALGIIGGICGFSASVASFMIADLASGVWALVSAAFAALSIYSMITHQPTKRQLHTRRERNAKEILKLIGQVILVGIIISLILVNLLSAIQACVLTYNFSHFQPPGVLYTINKSGSKMHINCEGTGAPVVLLHHGLFSHSLEWSWVQPEVAKYTKVCSFDRTGFGWSDPIGRERTSDSHADELHALLEAAGLGKSQFIFAGSSISSVYMNAFIHKYTKQHDVCGLMCVDCVDPSTPPFGITTNWEQQLKAPYLWDLERHLLPTGTLWMLVIADTLPNITTIQKLPERVHPAYMQNLFKPAYLDSVVLEYEYLPLSIHQTIGYGNLGDMPIAVITAGKGFNATNLSKMSVNSTKLDLPNAGHDMVFSSSYAEMFVTQIKHLVDMVRISGFCNTYLPNKPQNSSTK